MRIYALGGEVGTLDLPVLEFSGFLPYALAFALGKKKSLCSLLGFYSVTLKAEAHLHQDVGREDMHLRKHSPGR